MPLSKSAPARSSQRRNSQQDDTPTRTRGRGAKPAPSKSDASDIIAPNSSPTKLSPTMTRKTTRSASNISGNSIEVASDIYASYEHPLFMVFGLSPEFFNGLKKHHGKLPKERKIIVGSFTEGSPTPEEDATESEEETASETDDDMPVAPQPTPRGRGRGGRGSRGGRGRGGRGRGRGGRGRGGFAKAASSASSRAARNGSAIFPFTEGDDTLSNQSTPISNAKTRSRLVGSASEYGSDDDNEEAIEDDESEPDYDAMDVAEKSQDTPQGSQPPDMDDSNQAGSHTPVQAGDSKAESSSKTSNRLGVPKISLLPQSASQTPRESVSTPAESAVPKLLDPEEDVLSDSDLPDPFIYDAPSPIEAECEDRADYLLQKRFKPMIDVQAAIAALTKFPASQRSTENLYALTENAQHILRAWQDEYLMLDARTAPHMHPAKKACNGGRIPLAPEIFEDMKEADLYGYTYDPKKPSGCQDPWAQRPGAEKGGRRELRTRRTRDMLESAAPSEEEYEDDNEGRPSKRQRKAPRKFDGTDTGTGGATTPKKHNGWGGARKKGVSRFAKPASETPEPESRPVKRARATASNLLHQRIQEMREESIIGSSGDEESSTVDVDEYTEVNPKRGRPAGSKNSARRSDYGVKKGPRKKPADATAPVTPANGTNPPPPALNSMSEGQGQFTIDAQPFAESTPLKAPNSAETVFQGTPQNAPAPQEVPLVHPSESSTPDAYMLTAPLSQYTNNYVDESAPASGSRRKPRVKSEKRSQSMTMWWAERKAKKREQDEKEGKPVKPTPSRSNSTGRKGARQSGGASAVATPQSQQPESQQASPVHHAQHATPQHSPHHAPPEAYLHYTQGPPAPPPQHYMYVSAPGPPPHMMMSYSPLAALPTSSFPGPFSHYPPHHQQGIPLAQPSSTGGPFGGGPRQLAPAPSNMPTYPSPYGPQSPAGGRPKSRGQSIPKTTANGQQALAPAPPHQQQGQHQQPQPTQPVFSPYVPASSVGREMPFKVMVPGPTPERRESR